MEQFEYPIYKQNIIRHKCVVKFTSLKSGVIVRAWSKATPGQYGHNAEVGYFSDKWSAHTSSSWQDTDFRPKPKINLYL